MAIIISGSNKQLLAQKLAYNLKFKCIIPNITKFADKELSIQLSDNSANLFQEDVINDYPQFKDQGLNSLEEKIFLLKPY